MPRVSPLLRRRIPALLETDSYQGTPSGVPPTTHPAGPRPSGATATARSFTLPSHQSPAAHESWVCRRRVVFGWIDSGELKHCFYIAPVALQSAGDSARCFLQFALLGGGRKGRGRHIGSGRGLSCGRGRFRLRRGRRRRCTRFFRGGGRPRYVSLFGGQGHGERGRSPHIGLFLRRRLFGGRGLGGRGRPPRTRFVGGRGRPPHTSIFKVGGGPGFVADDAFGNAEQIYSDIPVIWLKAGAAQVGGGDLQSIAAGRRLWCPPGGRRSCA